jgi:hypothetical protein
MRKPIILVELPKRTSAAELANIHVGFEKNAMSKDYYMLCIISNDDGCRVGMLGFNWFATQFLFRKIIHKTKQFINGFIGAKADETAEIQPGEATGSPS